MAWRFQKKRSYIKMDKCYVVVVKRAGSAFRWVWVWVPTMPITAVRHGTNHTPHLFEPTENPSRSPHCPRDGVTIPSTTVKALKDLAHTDLLSSLYSQALLDLFQILECSMLFHTKGILHVLFLTLEMKTPLPLNACPLHLVKSHSYFRPQCGCHFS